MVKNMKDIQPEISENSKKDTELQASDQLKKEEETTIRETAFLLSKKGLSYNDLCWILAEKQLNVSNDKKRKVTKSDIKKKSEEIFKASKKYDELCWFIAKIDVINKI